MKALLLTVVVGVALAVTSCGGDDDSSTVSSESTSATTTESSKPASKTKPEVTVPKGTPPKKLEIKDLEKGSGATAKAGDQVTVQYVGVGYASGEEFDASWDRGEPYSFPLGRGEVIPGWDQGVEGMKGRWPPRADHPARARLRRSGLPAGDWPERNPDLRHRPARGRIVPGAVRPSSLKIIA